MINSNVIENFLIRDCDIEQSNINEKLKELKKIVEGFSFKILPNNVSGKICIDKIFIQDNVICSLSADIFSLRGDFFYEKYTSKVIIHKSKLDVRLYKKILLANIYTYVIKNKIMVL